MGARAALLHAIAFPSRWDALILISANPGIENETERTARALSDTTLADRITREGLPAFLEYWQQTPIIQSQQGIRADWHARMQQNRLQQTAKGLSHSLKQFGPASCPNMWPQLGTIQCPVLLMTGERDKKYTAIAQRMCDLLPKVTWQPIPNVGHMPHLEAPEVTARMIRSFVDQLTTPSSAD
jgi:2-succinyl-6-hydroxy-2,4-cyclohexadiene-1-carboxylate synthase